MVQSHFPSLTLRPHVGSKPKVQEPLNSTNGGTEPTNIELPSGLEPAGLRRWPGLRQPGLCGRCGLLQGEPTKRHGLFYVLFFLKTRRSSIREGGVVQPTIRFFLGSYSFSPEGCGITRGFIFDVSAISLGIPAFSLGSLREAPFVTDVDSISHSPAPVSEKGGVVQPAMRVSSYSFLNSFLVGVYSGWVSEFHPQVIHF